MMSILIKGITIEQFYKDLNTADDMDVGWDIMQLPPHGRLIDADALMPNAEYKGKHDILTAYDVIVAPTIIDAEGCE